MKRRELLKSLLLAPFAGLLARTVKAENRQTYFCSSEARQKYLTQPEIEMVEQLRMLHAIRSGKGTWPKSGSVKVAFFVDETQKPLAFNCVGAIENGRRSGKTTALAAFVHERQQALGDPWAVGVIAPDWETLERFVATYIKWYPCSIVPVCRLSTWPHWEKANVREVYADDIFQIPTALAHVKNLYAGVGTEQS